jgi:hypothetical protein
MRLVGRLKKLETIAEEKPRVRAAGVVWTSDHEHYARGICSPGSESCPTCTWPESGWTCEQCEPPALKDVIRAELDSACN